MFISLSCADYPVHVNTGRVMWVAPHLDGGCILYMNVADNRGSPAEVIVTEDYKTVVKLLNGAEDEE